MICQLSRTRYDLGVLATNTEDANGGSERSTILPAVNGMTKVHCNQYVALPQHTAEPLMRWAG
jgi:hypothetical protein